MQKVYLRPLEEKDLPLLLAWAHIKEIWEYLPTSREEEDLTWERHLDWWKSREERVDWIIMVKTDGYGFRPVGVAHVNLKGVELGIYIGEITLWNKGVAEVALLQAIGILRSKGYSKFCALVHSDNERSRRLFEGIGFKKVGKGRRDQDWYECSFS